MSNINNIQPWDKMLKQILFEHLSEIEGLKILDFGSGDGVTASFLAAKNEVIAVEPSQKMLEDVCKENPYAQIHGGIEEVKKFDNEYFDFIVCHNVMEYVDDKADYFNELVRVLKVDGRISIVKHNRTGRIMQSVVLLNNFEHAYELLEGKNSHASKFGAIRYYDDEDIVKWCPKLHVESCKGIRTFWDLQQNQEIHKDAKWQEMMIQMERKIEDVPEYREIAFFHHLIFSKNK